MPLGTNEITAWLEAGAAAASLLVIILLARYSSRMQKQFIDREEAHSVKPVLVFTSSGGKDTAMLEVQNVGRGTAFDIKINVCPDSWIYGYGSKPTLDLTSRYRTIKLDFLPANTPPKWFDTGITIEDIKNESKQFLVIWGDMVDENGKSLPVREHAIPKQNFISDRA